MTKSESQKLFSQVARDYTQYLHFNPSSDCQYRAIEDGIEDLELRVTEFEHLLEMIKSDSSFLNNDSHLPEMLKQCSDMEKVFDKIDRLELLVSRVNAELEEMDNKLTEAESTVVGAGSANHLKALVPAFISSKLGSLSQEPKF